MVCEMPKQKLSNKVAFCFSGIAFLIMMFVVIDNFMHYHEYRDMQTCRDTFHETCKLIAVPESVNGLLDGTK